MKNWYKNIGIWLLFGILPSQAFSQDSIPESNSEVPKNIILMVGDGMGVSQVALMCYRAQLVGSFYLDSFEVVGFQKTHSYSSIITDSGAAATAMATGVKTYNSAIGVGPDTLPRKNLFEMCKAKNMHTGLVVTSSLTDATPGAFVGHRTYRGFKDQIALDYLSENVEFIIGGGSNFFDDRYTDNRNLLQEMRAKDYQVNHISGKQFEKKINDEHEKYLFFTSGKDPISAYRGRDYFPKGIETACSYLSRDENGFFMVAEASQIDFACHQNDEVFLITELLDFNNAIKEAYTFAKMNKETLIIVTADHECGDLILEPTKAGHKPRFAFKSNKHTPQMVPVFAYGPGSEQFNGIFDNTEIFRKIKLLLDLQ